MSQFPSKIIESYVIFSSDKILFSIESPSVKFNNIDKKKSFYSNQSIKIQNIPIYMNKKRSPFKENIIELNTQINAVYSIKKHFHDNSSQKQNNSPYKKKKNISPVFETVSSPLKVSPYPQQYYRKKIKPFKRCYQQQYQKAQLNCFVLEKKSIKNRKNVNTSSNKFACLERTDHLAQKRDQLANKLMERREKNIIVRYMSSDEVPKTPRVLLNKEVRGLKNLKKAGSSKKKSKKQFLLQQANDRKDQKLQKFIEENVETVTSTNQFMWANKTLVSYLESRKTIEAQSVVLENIFKYDTH